MAQKPKAPTGYGEAWINVQSNNYYKTLQGQLLIEADINQRYELLEIGSSSFKHWITNYLNKRGLSINAEGMKNLISRLEAKVWSQDKTIEVYSRIAQSKKAIYYDLCNHLGEIIKISKHGVSVIQSNKCITKFIRNANMREQCRPLNDKDISIFDLEKFINVKSKRDLHLLLIYIVSCFIPSIAHPILITMGSHGAAKTTSNILIKRIVDPAYADAVSLPKDKRDLIVQLNRGYMHFYDNIRKISPEFNDIFCQASTGGYQIARKLHSDNDIVAYKLQRCLLLNGIAELTDQPDLLDRSITIRYERISEEKRITEAELYSNFNAYLPYFLNDIFNIVSQVLGIIDDVKLDKLPRMADFTRWGYAIAEVMGIGGDTFLDYYANNQQRLCLELLQADTTAMAIIEFMHNIKFWKGSVKRFWERLSMHVAPSRENKHDPTWAKTPNVLGKRLVEMKVNLESLGIYFTKTNTGRHKELHIWQDVTE